MSLFYCFDTVGETYQKLADQYNLKLVTVACHMPLILLTSRRNPLARRREVDFSKIKNLRCIMYENFKFDEWLRILGFENDYKILYVYDRGRIVRCHQTEQLFDRDDETVFGRFLQPGLCGDPDRERPLRNECLPAVSFRLRAEPA